MIAQIIFWLCIFLLVYSYLLYPALVALIYYFSSKPAPPIHNNESRIFILMAAHNEKLVIKEKLDSINANDYPSENVSIYIGSDNSTDGTNKIIEKYISKSKYPIAFKVMEKRSGKIGTINSLSSQINEAFQITEEDIFIITDADVLLTKHTISNLCRHFQDPKIGIVDTRIINESTKGKSVSKSESKYLNREFDLKHQEGIAFGKLMGTFGGCFAIRAKCFTPVPLNYKVDDFYLTMHTLAKGYKAISDPEAICTEKIVSTFTGEFKRKRRLSSGNYQNMKSYARYVLPFSSLGFVFFSHKVIRYIGPILMLIAFTISSLLAINGNELMQVLVIGQLFWYVGIPLIDRLFSFFGLNLLTLRSVSYFNYMNLALLLGLKDFIYGIESNIWEPSKRT